MKDLYDNVENLCVLRDFLNEQKRPEFFHYNLRTKSVFVHVNFSG